MSNPIVNHPLFLVSAALNIFFVAFIFGRLTGQPAFMPPPPFMGGPAGQQARQMPPPFMGPDDIFSPKEKEENYAALKTQFDKARELGEAFAARVKEGPVTKEEVIRHFAEIDAVMDRIKSVMQAKVAEKLSTMDEKGRADFAAHLLKKVTMDPKKFGMHPEGADRGPGGRKDGPASGQMSPDHMDGPPPGPRGDEPPMDDSSQPGK